MLARLADRPAGSTQSAIVDELRAVILHGQVPPGSAIPVDAVATAFGVSRIPVREALMTLIGEGLVDHRANGGYRVAMMTAREFGEIYLVREALESAALRVAVAGASSADDRTARAALRSLDQAIEADDGGAAYHRESRRFHLALIAPCRMRRLVNMLESAWNMTEPLRPMSHLTGSERELLHSDHAGMLAAFLRRDQEALAGVCAVHHGRLQRFVAFLPRDIGLFAEGD
nr:GntR family transcriptional regulator [Actinoplanes derwentensis]